MWAAIGNVTTWVGLLAVLAGVATLIIRERTRREERQIQSAPETERAQLVALAMEKFHLDTSKLKGSDVVTLGLAQLHSRTVRLFIVAVVLAMLGIGVIIATVLITSSRSVAGSQPESSSTSPHASLQTAPPFIPSSPTATPPIATPPIVSPPIVTPPPETTEATPSKPPVAEPAPIRMATARATPKKPQPAPTSPATTPPATVNVSSEHQNGGITAGTINNTGTIVVNSQRPTQMRCSPTPKDEAVGGKHRWTWTCELVGDALLPKLTVIAHGADVDSVTFHTNRAMDNVEFGTTADGSKGAALENAAPGEFRVEVTTVGAHPPNLQFPEFH